MSAECVKYVRRFPHEFSSLASDENIFVAQTQLLFQRFQNKLYNERVHQEPGTKEFNRFEEAQTQTRYHYQWLVLFDFLKRLCDPKVVQYAVPKILACDGTDPHFYQPDDCKILPMPVEFSVAAYRVGHTMVRSSYAVNDKNLEVEFFDERFGTLGFSELPEDLVVDWRYLLPVASCIRPRVHGCHRLGPVGSAILLEVFGGMLVHCGNSFVHRHRWHPDPCVSK